MSKETCDDFLMGCMTEICHPPAEYRLDKSTTAHHPKSQQFKVKQLMQSFLDKATPMFIDLFRIKCCNKSRQRRNLAKLVQEWEGLQLEVWDF